MTGSRRFLARLLVLTAASIGLFVAVLVLVPYHDDEFDAVPYLDAVATWNEAANEVTIFALNRNLSDPLRVEGDVRAFTNYRIAEHIVLSHPELKATNNAENPGNVTPSVTGNSRLEDGLLTATLGPASWHVIRLVR